MCGPAADVGAFAEVVDVVGADAAKALMARYGGQEVTLPSRQPSEPLRELIGSVAARRLVGEFGGLKLYIPTNARPEREERNRKIVEARRRGLLIADIAREFGLTERTVFYVLAAD